MTGAVIAGGATGGMAGGGVAQETNKKNKERGKTYLAARFIPQLYIKQAGKSLQL